MDENPNYLKVVEADCQLCKYWQRDDHCNFPGKIKIRNGVCTSLKTKENTIIINRLTTKGKSWLP